MRKRYWVIHKGSPLASEGEFKIVSCVLGSRVAKRQTAHSTVKGLGNFLIALEP